MKGIEWIDTMSYWKNMGTADMTTLQSTKLVDC